MKKKLLLGAGVVAVSCAAMLGGIFGVSTKVDAGPGMAFDRSPILGFSAVSGDVFLSIDRADIASRVSKGETNVVLAKYIFSNGGSTNIEVNVPRFYALADKSFTLAQNVRNVGMYYGDDSLYMKGLLYMEGSPVGNRIEFPGQFTIPAYGEFTIEIKGDIINTAKIDTIDFEPDFTSPKFVINYADEMGNDLALAPFNLAGGVQSLEFSDTAGGIDVSTASDATYAKYYWGIEGTLTSPYIPEGAIMRNEAGIDVYIAKYKNNKRFKRLILSPSVFKSYGHLKWENVLIVNDAVMNSYTTSDYVFVAGENKIWRLEPQGDTGIKREFEGYGNPVWAFDTDGLYEINAVDRDSYVTGAKIER